MVIIDHRHLIVFNLVVFHNLNHTMEELIKKIQFFNHHSVTKKI